MSLRYGSLIRPFQPTVVRGFSKYTHAAVRSAWCFSISTCFHI
ncbi:Uncharacterised protein [Vibrio cholerae]|nr:Uncharacterised protein [Vibrio cholerae]